MLIRTFFSAIIFSGIIANCSAQNFSGLQGKKLFWAPDLGSVKESFIGRLFGAIEGTIDSVVVTNDTETELQLLIYYKDYVNGYFSISALNESRKVESHIETVTFNQSERNSPAECILKLKTESVPNPLNASPYLRIEIAKKANGRGKVKLFILKKNWALGGGVVVPDTTGGGVTDSSGGSVHRPVGDERTPATGRAGNPLKGPAPYPSGAQDPLSDKAFYRRFAPKDLSDN